MEAIRCLKIVLLLAGLAVLQPAAARPGQVWDLDLRDFAMVEKAYIRTLLLAGGGKAEPALKALSVFRVRWEEFKKGYRRKESGDLQWREDVQEVDTLLAETEAALGKGASLAEAGESLEAVRFVFQSIRRRSDMLYILDYMTDFHEVMEGIDAFGSARPSPVSVAEKARLAELLDEAQALWKGVRERQEDATYFGFSEEKRAKMAELFDREDAALAKVRDALTAGDAGQLRAAARMVRPPYAEAFGMFGE